ncbi:hypothetical protein [Pseudomaricurvus sp.]|uniref:hypothetical protein n=1 Tax=Pseudomaricurvus sp. TaxID=2004510 RepID=UPI003F6C2768
MNTAVLSTTEQTYRVKGSLLLSLYLIIPLCFVTAALDTVFLDHRLRDIWLPSNPANLLFWAIIFNFPHIVSSLVTLADKEYLSFYRRRLIKGLSAIFALVFAVNYLAPMVLSKSDARIVYYAFFFFLATYTMHHVFSQQFGIGMAFMKVARSRRYEFFRGCATVAGTLMYMSVFGKTILRKVEIVGLSGNELAVIITGIFVVLTTVQGILICRQSNSKLGKKYMHSNLWMIASAYLFLVLDYDFFVIAIPRFIHDITAFIIYSVHDQNRNYDKKHNYVYRFLSFLPLTPLLLCPVLAIFLAAFMECGTYLLDTVLGFYPKGNSNCMLQEYYAPDRSNSLPFNMQLGLQLIFVTSLFHYYVEGFVWHRDSIHRHSVKFET